MPRSVRFLLLAALVVFTAGAQAQGVLTFERLEYDFGSIAEGEKPTYTFTFTNAGDAPVTLTAVRPSCGCTAPSYSTEAVRPGAEGSITVEYNSQGRPGPFNKSIYVEAEGAEPNSATLYITGTVVPVNIQNGNRQGGVVFDADLHVYGFLPPAEPVAHTFRMQNTGAGPLRINGVRTFPDGVQVDHPTATIFPGDIVELLVMVPRADAAVNGFGHFDIAVLLDTNDTDQPTKSLRLRGQIEPAQTAGGTQ